MNALRLLTPFLVLAAAGCAPMQWVKADAGPQQLQADSVECQQEAWREARFRNWYYSPVGPFIGRDPFGRATVIWPSGRYGMGFSDQFLEEGRLAQFCMRAKGWQLVPVPEGKEGEAKKQTP
jgi:hypothetical protein